MATGLQVPLIASKSGGAPLQDDNTQLDKLVVLALLEGGDDNPFQELGLSPSILYRDNSDEAKFDVKNEVEQKLKAFKGRLSLTETGVVISEKLNPESPNEYSSFVSFDYINMDVNDVREFASAFTELGDK